MPEYYNHDEVRQYIQEELKIPEEMADSASSGSSNIHEDVSSTQSCR